MTDRTLSLGPVNLAVRLTRNPDFRWFRFSVRRLMLVVLVMAVACTVLVNHLRAQGREQISITYPVGDLVSRVDLDPRFTTLNGVSTAVVKDVPNDRWAPAARSVTPFFLSVGLIVRDSKSGHRRVIEYLNRLRSRTRPVSP